GRFQPVPFQCGSQRTPEECQRPEEVQHARARGKACTIVRCLRLVRNLPCEAPRALRNNGAQRQRASKRRCVGARLAAVSTALSAAEKRRADSHESARCTTGQSHRAATIDFFRIDGSRSEEAAEVRSRIWLCNQ